MPLSPAVRRFARLFALLAVAGPLASCDSTRPPGPPAQLIVDALPENPVVQSTTMATVRVVDERGTAVPDASVAYTVTQYLGVVTQGQATSDAEGRVSISWTMDFLVRPYTITATSGALVPLTVVVTSVPGPAVAFWGFAFGGSNGFKGTLPVGSVTTPPVVALVDAYGNQLKRAGVPVTFAVTGGGGSVSRTTSLTNADGVAGTDVSWTLGSAEGPNTLLASSGSVSGTFTAFGIVQNAAISVIGVGGSTWLGSQPSVNGDDAGVMACVTSTAPVVSVQAFTADRSGTLQPSGFRPCDSNGWRGGISLAGLPRGPINIRIVATNATGVSATTYVQVIHDNPPVITWSGTPDHALANPTITVAATCTDIDNPNGCGPLTLRDSAGNVLATGSSPLNATISLAAYDGRKVTLTLEATSDGWHRQLTRDFYVETAPLALVAGSDGLPVVDYEPATGRLLETSQVYSYAPVPTSFNVITPGAPTSYISASLTDYRARLTPGGATVIGHTSNAGSDLYHLLNGTLSSRIFVGAPGPAPISTDARYLAYSDNTSVFRRELATGAEVRLANTVLPSAPAANGDVAYVGADHEMYLYRNATGTSTKLTSDAGAFWNSSPVADGVNVAYVKFADPSAPGPVQFTQRVMLHDGTREIALTTAGTASSIMANAGWTAWVHALASAPGAYHLFVRSPSGQVSDLQTVTVSAGVTGPTIDALGSDGTATLRTPTGLFKSSPSSTATRIGSTAAVAIWRDGTFYVLRSGVYRIP